MAVAIVQLLLDKKMGLKRKRKMKRRKGILWDYNGDGLYEEEKIKGYWKRYWCKWYLRQLYEEDFKEYKNVQKKEMV